MEVNDIAKKRNELRATINNLIGEFVKDTGCGLEISSDQYQEIGKVARPIISLMVIIP